MRNRRNTIIIDGKKLPQIAEENNIKYTTLIKRYEIHGNIKQMKICNECKKEYVAYRSNQKFCSNRCRKKYSRRYKK